MPVYNDARVSRFGLGPPYCHSRHVSCCIVSHGTDIIPNDRCCRHVRPSCDQPCHRRIIPVREPVLYKIRPDSTRHAAGTPAGAGFAGCRSETAPEPKAGSQSKGSPYQGKSIGEDGGGLGPSEDAPCDARDTPPDSYLNRVPLVLNLYSHLAQSIFVVWKEFWKTWGSRAILPDIKNPVVHPDRNVKYIVQGDA